MNKLTPFTALMVLQNNVRKLGVEENRIQFKKRSTVGVLLNSKILDTVLGIQGEKRLPALPLCPAGTCPFAEAAGEGMLQKVQIPRKTYRNM